MKMIYSPQKKSPLPKRTKKERNRTEPLKLMYFPINYIPTTKHIKRILHKMNNLVYGFLIQSRLLFRGNHVGICRQIAKRTWE